MPRIEIKRASPKSGQEPSLTLDLCNCCYHEARFHKCIEGCQVPADLLDCLIGNDDFGITIKDTVGSNNVKHQPYEADQVTCCMCRDFLTEDDNNVMDFDELLDDEDDYDIGDDLDEYSDLEDEDGDEDDDDDYDSELDEDDEDDDSDLDEDDG